MKNANIIVIGGANIEYIVKSDTNIIQGSKNYVEIEELYGGSGLNYTLRLLKSGKQVTPLLYVGKDSIGIDIQKHLLDYCDGFSSKFIDNDNFFVKGIKTLRSVIVVEGSYRTILAQDQNSTNLFLPFLKNRLTKELEVSSVVIGHIHNDASDINKDSNELSTEFVIDYFSNLKKLIYCNFGSSQLSYGFSFWKDRLRMIDMFQLNIHEAKSFFKISDKPPTLLEIVEHLCSLRISGVITLDKFGAIGFTKVLKATIFMARPVWLGDELVDSTGAGDAFCAGMVYSLDEDTEFSAEKFKIAMEVARSWSVYACKSYGGANACPSLQTIEAFHEKINIGNEVLLYKDKQMVDILSIIDSTFENVS
jgi:sugar/nucleoside kinase (ribokinase family)